MKFGIREITNVMMKAKSKIVLGNKTYYKDEPILYFDTLKTSSLEGASTTVYATGGRGNARLVAWEGEKTLTFNMEDALLTPESFSILSSASLKDYEAINLYPLQKEVTILLNDWVRYLANNTNKICDEIIAFEEQTQTYYTTETFTGVPYIVENTSISSVEGYKLSNVFENTLSVHQVVNIDLDSKIYDLVSTWLTLFKNNDPSNTGVGYGGVSWKNNAVEMQMKLVLRDTFKTAIEELTESERIELQTAWSNIYQQMSNQGITLAIKYNVVNSSDVNKEPTNFEHVIDRVAVLKTTEADEVVYSVKLSKPIKTGEVLYLKPANSFTKLGKVLVAPEEDGVTYSWKESAGKTAYEGDKFIGMAIADYYTPIYDKKVKQIVIDTEMSGMNFYLEADTLFRDTNGFDHPAIFVIPNCKVQSNFTFNMASSGDPSTFNFVLDAFPGYTRFDSKKKVLAAMQILGEEVVTFD